YRAQRDVMVRALERECPGALSWAPPRGGFFLWAQLTDGSDGDGLLSFAQERGVIFVAGSAFFVSGQERQWIRLSFSSATPERIETGVARLAAAISDAAAPLAATAPVSHGA